ncbi:MAG: hypothetical protein V4707_04895 [Pseudomonadota bacterium]
MKYILISIAAAVTLAAPCVAAAQDGNRTLTEAERQEFDEWQADRDQKTRETEANRREFAGLDLGVGISVTFDFGGIERISEAEVVSGVVRVKDEDDARARIMLESHYFFTPSGTPFGVAQGDWGVGPFVAIQPGTDEVIEAAALGVMMGFRREGTGDSFNIGIGVAVDPNTRTLGDGIERDMPLPVGETAVRYKEESQFGLVILTSFTF